jgi:glycosyltransferase involved in cell wall biosynthesis
MDDALVLSVVIPTYNRAYILREAIDSVLCQDLPSEVIVVDDGSTDDTASVIAGYDGRVRYTYQENRGAAAARNTGMRQVRGEFISLLDSDDVWLPGKTKAELQLFSQHPDVGAIASDAESYREGRLVSQSWTRNKGLPMTGDEPFLLPLDSPHWLTGSLFATCCLTFRKTVLKFLGDPVFDPALRSFSDWELEIKLLRFCGILVLPKVTAQVRRFDDGTRGDRTMPGSIPSPTYARTVLERRRRVVRNALRLGGWPAEVQAALEQLNVDLHRQLS